MNTVAFGGRVYGVSQVTTKSGVLLSKFRIQIQRYKKDSFYLEVNCFDKNAEFVNNHVQDGCGVFVTGKLDEDKWTKDDVQHSRMRIIADRVEFLPTNQKKDAADADNTNGVANEVVTQPTKDDF